MELSIYNIQGKETGRKIVLDESIFGVEPNDHTIYLAVKQYMANKRQGTNKSKERSEVSGSTRKLGRQKGGGGARPGDINSPVRVGGGRVFGPTPRDYSFKLNKKLKQLARKSALSYKAKDNGLTIVEDFTFDAPKTKNFTTLLNNLVFGIVPEWQRRGIDGFMIWEGTKHFRKTRNYTDYEMQWIGDFNPRMIKI